MRTSRMEGFSDGVFAIPITLLVLEISVPAGSEEDLLGAVLDQWPSYLAYVVSFASVGAVWLAHTVVTEYLHHADAWLLLVSALWRYAVRASLVRPDAPDDDLALLTRRLTPGLAGYVVMICAQRRHPEV